MPSESISNETPERLSDEALTVLDKRFNTEVNRRIFPTIYILLQAMKAEREEVNRVEYEKADNHERAEEIITAREQRIDQLESERREIEALVCQWHDHEAVAGKSMCRISQILKIQ